MASSSGVERMLYRGGMFSGETPRSSVRALRDQDITPEAQPHTPARGAGSQQRLDMGTRAGDEEITPPTQTVGRGRPPKGIPRRVQFESSSVSARGGVPELKSRGRKTRDQLNSQSENSRDRSASPIQRVRDRDRDRSPSGLYEVEERQRARERDEGLLAEFLNNVAGCQGLRKRDVLFNSDHELANRSMRPDRSTGWQEDLRHVRSVMTNDVYAMLSQVLNLVCNGSKRKSLWVILEDVGLSSDLALAVATRLSFNSGITGKKWNRKETWPSMAIQLDQVYERLARGWHLS